MVRGWHIPAAVFSHRVTRGVGALLLHEPQLKGGWFMKWSCGDKWQIPSLLRRWAQICADYGLETVNLSLVWFRVSINPLVQCPLDWLCNISPCVSREARGLCGSGWIFWDESRVSQFHPPPNKWNFHTLGLQKSSEACSIRWVMKGWTNYDPRTVS